MATTSSHLSKILSSASSCFTAPHRTAGLESQAPPAMREPPATLRSSLHEQPSFADHHVGGFDDGNHLVVRGEVEVIDRLVGDRGGDNHAIADVDLYMRGGRAVVNFDHTTDELVSRADLSGMSAFPAIADILSLEIDVR